MRSKDNSTLSQDVKKIMLSLKRIEAKINECCPSCIDFTTQKVGKLPFDLTGEKVEKDPHKYKLSVGSYKLELDYPVTDPPGLDIEPTSPTGNENGISIPQKLIIDIKPPSRRVAVEIAKSTPYIITLTVLGNNKVLQELSAPEKEMQQYTFNVNIGRKVDRLMFATGHKEVQVKRICCYS
jgi:hypothetical protein